MRRRPPASRFHSGSALEAARGPTRAAARAIDLETIENVTAIVFDTPPFNLELRIEQSDNDGDLVVRNDSGEAIVVQLLRAAKVIDEVPLESDESWHFHPE